MENWNPAVVTPAILYVDVSTLQRGGTLWQQFVASCGAAGLTPNVNDRQCWKAFKPALLKDLRTDADTTDQLTIYIIAGNHTNKAMIILKQQGSDLVEATRPADIYLSFDITPPDFALLSRLDNDRVMRTVMKHEAQRPEMRVVIYRCVTSVCGPQILSPHGSLSRPLCRGFWKKMGMPQATVGCDVEAKPPKNDAKKWKVFTRHFHSSLSSFHRSLQRLWSCL